MQNLPTRNQNPGDLRDPSTGNFRKFNSPQEGFDALKNDLQIKISGRSNTGVTPDSDLLHFASKYAPKSDGNDPEKYAQNLATKLGVPVNTPIKNLSNRLDEFAGAIADNEGYQGNRVLGTSQNAAPASEISGAGFKPLSPDQYQKAISAGFSPEQILKNEQIRKSQVNPRTQSPTDSNGFVNNATIVPGPATGTPQEQKPGLVQSAIQGISSPFLKMEAGASKILGRGVEAGARLVGQKDFADKLDKSIDKSDKEGIDYGYFGKVKPVGAGFDVRKSIPENIAPLADAVGTGASVGSDIALGESLLNGASGLVGRMRAPSALTQVTGQLVEEATGQSASKFATMAPTDKFNALQATLDSLKGTGDAANKLVLQRAMEEVAPKVLIENGIGSFAELHPSLAKTIGLSSSGLKTLLKWGIAGAGFAGVNSLTSGLLPK